LFNKNSEKRNLAKRDNVFGATKYQNLKNTRYRETLKLNYSRRNAQIKSLFVKNINCEIHYQSIKLSQN